MAQVLDRYQIVRPFPLAAMADQFMNIVLDNTVGIVSPIENEFAKVVIRGNSIMMWECLDRVK